MILLGREVFKWSIGLSPPLGVMEYGELVGYPICAALASFSGLATRTSGTLWSMDSPLVKQKAYKVLVIYSYKNH